MGELVKTLERYFEFLILGILLLSICSAWMRALFEEKWQELRRYAVSRFPEKEKSNTRTVVLGAIIVGCLYLLGFTVNNLGFWLLQPAHIHIVEHTASQSSKKANTTQPDPAFFLRPIYPMRELKPEAYIAFHADEARQIQWLIKQRVTFNETVDWALKPIRIVRGLVFLSLILFAACLCVVLVRVISGRKGKPLGRWFAGIALSAIAYYSMMGTYWQYESLVHHDIWTSEEFVKQLPYPDAKDKPAAGGG